MKIRILGADGGIAPGRKTTSFLVNDKILIDAGSAASSLSIQRQEKIQCILISHPHLDHVKEIPFIADNLVGTKRKPVELISTKEILGDIQKHLLNNVLWPDMTRIPPGAPVLKYRPIKEKVVINGLTIRIYPVNHPGHAMGFLLHDKNSAVMITGDTGPTDLLWDMANREKHLKAVFTEVAFPSAFEKLALAAGHFTPKMLKEELLKLKKKDIPVYIYHFKPRFSEILFKETMDLGIAPCHIVDTEDEFVF